MKTGAIIQARMGSTRLPGKVMKKVLGRPLLFYLLERVKRAKKIDEIIVATSDLPTDRPIADFAVANGAYVFRGSETDVLDRYFRAAKERSLDYIVRITADCPLLDGPTIDWFVSSFFAVAELDYLGTGPTFPEGYDMEIFKMSALEKAWHEATSVTDREHVTPYIRRHTNCFSAADLPSPWGDLSWLRVTIDEDVDFNVVSDIIQRLYPLQPAFDLDRILSLVREFPEIMLPNQLVKRNERYNRFFLEEGKIQNGEA